jgi:hypothetical protein
MNILYLGPSWAMRSYNTPNNTDTEITNIAQELQLDVIPMAEEGGSNRFLLKKLHRHLKNNPQHKHVPIIWFYAEPFLDSWWYDDCVLEKFIQTPNWNEIRSSTNQKILKEIAELDHPVALIGSHSDIFDCNHSNISVIHPSWQKFLAGTCNIKFDRGWGAEVAHKSIISNPDVKPSYSLVDAITETFNSWHKFEMNHLFQICHPNILGNKLFAQEIKTPLFNWLNKIDQ